LPARSRAAVIAVVLLLDVGAMFVLPELSALRDTRIDTTPVVYLQKHIGVARFATLGPLQPNYGSYWGIASVNVNDLPVPRDFANYVHQKLDPQVNPILFVGAPGGRKSYSPTATEELLAHLDGYREAGVRYI